MADPASTLEIRLDGVTFHAACTAGETLLDAALAAGIDMPYVCEEGHCGTCMGRLKGGTVDMPPALGLSARDRERGFILACQARATSPAVVLDYDD